MEPTQDAERLPGERRMVVPLPAGFVDASGVMHRDAELASVTGRDEEALALIPPELPVAAFVTELLRTCVTRLGTLGAATTALVRQLLVADRDWLVRQIRTLTHGPSMWIQLTCPSPECGATMEVNLPLTELPPRPADPPRMAQPLTLEDGRSFGFRLPTGADQEAVAPLLSDLDAARRALAERCLTAPPSVIDEPLLAALEARLEQEAPDVEVDVDAACPACGTSFVRRIDVVWLAVSELRAGARHLPREVHALASQYHWAERDILAMSRGRRHRYLALIAEA